MSSNCLIYIVSIIALVFNTQNLSAQALTKISAVQGTNGSSPMSGKLVTLEGVVTADFQDEKSFSGFFIQDDSFIRTSGASGGIFVYESRNRVAVGDLVMVSGEVSEHNGVTQLAKVSSVKVIKSKQKLPQPVSIQLPLQGLNLENLEGMRVTLEQPAIITDNYNFIKYGELTVSSQLSINPTNSISPGPTADFQKQQNIDDRLLIDDGSFNQFHHYDKIDPNTPAHIGAKVQVVGIMHFAFDKFRIEISEPIKFLETPFPKQAKPTEIDGKIKIASFNIRNYFTTIDENNNKCGPLLDFDCRGADTDAEFIRQQDKIVSAINTAQADVYAIQELENHKDTLKTLVTALNKKSEKNKWSHIETGALGEDVIRVGLIYKTKTITPVGKHQLLNAKVLSEFEGDKNREVLLQTFKDSDNNLFNVAVLHLKSKRCDDAIDLDKDQNDGQGCYNATRTKVAQQISDWLATDPTAQKAKYNIIAGDFNSYLKEDPITKFANNGYANLNYEFLPIENWTSIFRGEVGSIDHIVVNEAARKVAKGMTQWHINTMSMGWFDYNLEDIAEGKAKPKSYYQANPFSSSDHDMVIAGFTFSNH